MPKSALTWASGDIFFDISDFQASEQVSMSLRGMWAGLEEKGETKDGRKGMGYRNFISAFISRTLLLKRVL